MQWMHTTIESPILKGYEWSFGSGNGGYAEGMAETIAEFSRNVGFIEDFSNLSIDEINESLEQVDKYRAAYLRYWLPIFMFEVEFYKNLDQDPDDLKRELIQKYRLLDNPPEQVGSMLSIVYASYPLYTQNYVIAEVLSWQVHQALADKFGVDYPSNPKVGQYLIDKLYKDGELLHWQDRLKNATGKELDLDGYLTFYGIS
jgi:peptidyl-dipeptidase A